MKKYTLIILCLLGGWMAGCHDVTEGYLITDNAMYTPDTMEIRLVLGETLDAYRMHNLSPWVSPKLQGVIGTTPIEYEVVEVKATEGGNAPLFKHLVSVRGGGRMEFPLISDITPGRYTVSLRVFNEGYSHVINDVFTFIVR